MLEQLTNSITLISQQTVANKTHLSIILSTLWVAFFFTKLSGQRLLILGIIPRKAFGLTGIIFSPFLHINFNHIFFNSIPLVVLSNFLLMHGLTYYIYVSSMIIVISGILIWCFAKPGIHVGASALITGYWALLVSDIYQQGTLTAIILGVVSLYYFFGIFFGVFPGKRGVSWEGHFFGLLAGITVSYLMVTF